MAISFFYIFLGFFLLIKGGDYLVDGASQIARKFNIPQIIIGLTIVSIGTSTPELFVSIISSLEGYSDIVVGNIIGSNLCNLLLILGMSCIIMPIKFTRKAKIIEFPICLLVTFIFIIFCNTQTTITRKEGVILVILFFLFIIYTIIIGIRERKNIEKKETKEISVNNFHIVLKSIFLFVIGIIGLKIGGDFVVNNSVIIAENLNISKKIISLTVLAIGTSLPELVTSITAALKGNQDIAIGNILGSNISNILCIIGIASIINPITFNSGYNITLIILLWSTFLLIIFTMIPPKNKINYINGIIYILIYVFYMYITFNL